MWVALLVAALVVSACGSDAPSSTEGSTRTKNAALDVQTVACAVGGYGPAGGIVMKVGATTADESIEISRDWITVGSGAPTAGLPQVIAFADNLSRTTKPGWFIPDIDTLRANLALIQQVKGKENFWSSTPIQKFVYGVNSGGRDDFVLDYNIGAFRGVALRRFIENSEPCTPPPTTTTVAPTTTVPLACSAGGLCAVGDVGPGGGRIFSVNAANDGSTSYLEVAPADWAGTPPQSSLVTSTRVIVAPASTGDGAAALAGGYRGGGRSDWRLPDVAEMTLVCRSANNTLSAGAGMWASDSSSRTGKSTMSVAGRCAPYPAGGSQEGVVRPVRTNAVSAAVRQAAVDYYVANPTTTTSTTTTTTTLPPTTTTSSTTTTSTTTTTTSTTTTTTQPTTTTAAPTTTTTTVPVVPCVNLANCQVGQRGPGGGIIIERGGSSSSPEYLEIAPAGWDKGGRDPLVASSIAVPTASAYNGGGFSDWRLPTGMEIEIVCKFATRQLAATSSACPEPVGKIDTSFGDGTGARGASFYWHGSQPIRDRMDFASTRRTQAADAMSYVRPVRKWAFVPPTTTTIPNTTTTIFRSCAAGGPCKIGDISPTGGLIVDFSGSGSSMTYTEMASKDWRKVFDPQSSGEPAVPLAEMKNYVAVLAQRTASPWKLPTDRQMRAAFLFFANNPTFGPDCTANFSSWRTLTIEQQPFRFGSLSYWIEAAGRVNRFDNFNIAAGAAYYDVGSDRMYSGRPFAERPYRGGGNPIPATWPANSTGCATRTIPTTTTTTVLVGCAGGGRCNIGDIGPSGGLIIGIKRGQAPGDITYTEMQIATNSRFDCGNTGVGSRCLGGGYDDFERTRGLNGVFDDYPTVAELQLVARTSSLKARLGLQNSWYFSSTYRKTAMLTGDVNADSLAELGRSLELDDTTVGVAVYVASPRGDTREMTTAFFRGVNIWKCRFSCR